MCGISGIYNFNNKPINKNELSKLNNALAHRGPDNEGYWYNKNQNLGLGHRRLSILDLSPEGNLPMHYLGRYIITYNGEIFNFVEIKEELIAAGYTFSTQTDTEVILAAYDNFGKEMLNKFNGMWAFTIYDKQQNTLFCSRDRFGIKPFYYLLDNDKFIFASEVQAIHKFIGSKAELDKDVVINIATGRFDSFATSRTYLKNVNSLPGGFYLFLENEKLSINKWYKLPFVKVPKRFEDQAMVLKDLLVDATNLRLRSDVPVGTCLSGGVDSGSITSVINEISDKDNKWLTNFSHRSFCASFPNSQIDESRQAEKLARDLNSSIDIHVNNPPTPKELEEAMLVYDGPMHTLAFLPIWRLYKHIKSQKIDVTLDGQGPDEMLGGYSPLAESLETAWSKLDLFWFIDLYKTYAAQGESKHVSSKNKSKKTLGFFFRHKILYPPKFILSKLKLYDLNKLNPELTALQKEFTNVPPENYDALSTNLYNSFFNAPLPSILQQFDRCSMANSVECRMPFMDYRIVEFIFNLPAKSKVGKGYTKRILREAVKGILPDDIRLNKTKIGFNAPIVEWFHTSLKDWMLDQMSQPEFLNNNYFDGPKIKNEFIKFLHNPSPQWNEAWKFWPAVHNAWWLRQIKNF